MIEVVEAFDSTRGSTKTVRVLVTDDLQVGSVYVFTDSSGKHVVCSARMSRGMLAVTKPGERKTVIMFLR